MTDRRQRRRGTIREPAVTLFSAPEVVEEERNADGINEGTNLTQQGVATNIIHAAMLFVETPRCYEQLLHWRKEVSKPKIGFCLSKAAFVTRLLHDIIAEPGPTGILFESVKAVMNVDHSATRKTGEQTPLEVILPHVLAASSVKRGKQPSGPGSSSGAQLMGDLVPFLIRQARLYGIGTNQLPSHVGENLAELLVQVWQHMTPQTMSEQEVETMMAAVERLAKQWHEAPVSVLVASSPHLQRMLHTFQLYTKRALELSVKVLESTEYKTARLLLQELTARIQVEVGAWSRLTSISLHSALPGPVKMIRATPDAITRPTTASVAPPLANWVKIAPGRVRPWSAQMQLASPKARLPMPWREVKQGPTSTLENTLKPLAPEFLALRSASVEKDTADRRADEAETKEQLILRQRLKSAVVIKRNLIAFMHRRATARLAETQRQYCERMLAQSRSTSSALLADLRYMQTQVGASEGQSRNDVLVLDDNTHDEEQNEFRAYMQKAGIHR